MKDTYEGGCFCGEVRFTLQGQPEAMGYCHCESCRRWSAGPVNAFTLWKPAALTVTKGADRIESFNKTPRSARQWCGTCGGHLFTHHPAWDLVDVYAAAVPALPFKPGVHVHYQEARMRFTDGLPKMKDLPKEMGGSGMPVAE